MIYFLSILLLLAFELSKLNTIAIIKAVEKELGALTTIIFRIRLPS
jgi:hypothetical protein